MAEINEHREPLGEVDYPAEVKKALRSVTEMPSDLQEQADFFDKIQESLSGRLRDDS
ncbi:hypothetical protein RN607_07925 [Demequina capsici]|uniref:Uncharacterized protein n=1 Tax=Demequina capsici TaxID=3075620 RepID=A0AA96J982_9MICO|nr:MULTISPECIES: hypothetical protein [unclassified Demequina]WNM23251.1 hypothetical protein RN606_07690 [Demequina sp. OYTSA14]WNM26129.1 hypothetical protein RN607_07925 [Demequina sp. PMTSA13]